MENQITLTLSSDRIAWMLAAIQKYGKVGNPKAGQIVATFLNLGKKISAQYAEKFPGADIQKDALFFAATNKIFVTTAYGISISPLRDNNVYADEQFQRTVKNLALEMEKNSVGVEKFLKAVKDLSQAEIDIAISRLSQQK